MKNKITYLIAIIIILIGCAIYHNKYKKIQTIYKDRIIYKVKKITEVKQPKNVITQITKDDLIKDLSSSMLSIKNKQVLLYSIYKASKRYNIPIIVLYSLIYSESSFRFWIEHKPTKITINKKKITTRAIGLGGIIYEIWCDKLIKANIIQTKSDLYQIEPNVMATAYILDYLRKEPLKKGTTNSIISAMRRYYGGNVKAYTNKIKQKMSELLYKKVFNNKNK